ncbi:MAG TPA: hypothetical protein VHP31_09585 [Caproicibacter sp.]|nr:hypothetical protein [Caproicibacter sp.]
MFTKEERQQLKDQERAYKEKAKEHRDELKQLNAERKKDKRSKIDSSKITNSSKKKDLRPADQKKILSVFPIRDYQNNYFILDDESIIDLFQIQGRSYYDAADDEIENLVYNNAKFLQKYSQDFKFISLNYPTNTKLQQAFLSYKLKQPELSKYERFLEEKLAALQNLEQTTTDREAFIMVFAKDKAQYETLYSLLKQQSYFNFKPIEREKKENIIFQLNNMNKKIKV